MRVVFMGTPDFAVPGLKQLIADGYEVVLCVTQPDKPQGRKQILTAPPVKEIALTYGIPVYQPRSLKNDEAYETLAAVQPDVIVVAAYGKILPERILSLPPYGCINIHGSLLPHYRGAAPIQWAVLNGESESGVTIMRMDAGVDTGDILMQRAYPLNDTITAGELYEELAQLGADLLSEALPKWQAKCLYSQKQDEAKATYAPMLDKHLSPLDFTLPARVLHNRVRGLNPWPVASCRWEGKTLKVYVSEVGESTAELPGTVLSLSPLTVACGDGTGLIFHEVQYEGSKRMAARDFVRGHAVAVGTRLPLTEHTEGE